MNTALDRRRWQRLCWRLGIVDEIEQEFQRLAKAYGEPHRAYHTAQHINECLALLDWGADQDAAWRCPALEIALWYHDAVYQPQADDNEHQSADWAANFLQINQVAPEQIRRVKALIMATCHSTKLKTDQVFIDCIVDIDLAIIGAAPERFLQYDQQIKQEYSWLPIDLYQTGRQEILRQFLQRSVLYRSALFRNRFETRARENLSALLSTIH